MKGCPFCGSTQSLKIKADDGYFYVECQNCKARGPNYHAKTEAFDMWEKRMLRSPAYIITLDNFAHADQAGFLPAYAQTRLEPSKGYWCVITEEDVLNQSFIRYWNKKPIKDESENTPWMTSNEKAVLLYDTNVYKEPCLSAKVIFRLPKKQVVDVIGEVPGILDNSNRWLIIPEGYILYNYGQYAKRL